MAKAAIYTRVSTRDQDAEMQREELLAYAKRRGLEIVEEYTDVESGASFTRAGHDALMKAARRGKFGTVLVWKSDRIGRSLWHSAKTLYDLTKLDINVCSLTDGWDTGEPGGKRQAQMQLMMADWWLEDHIQRVRAGMARARQQGKHLGRPSLAPDKIEEITRLRSEGQSLREIAKTTGVSKTAVAKYARTSTAH